MRKLISVSAGMALAVAAFVAIPASAAPAVVVHDGGPCGLVGADADGNIIFGGLGEVTHIVQNGNHAVMTCKGSGITNDSGRGQHFSGFACTAVLPGNVFVVTEDSQATVSKSGQATTKCRVSFGEV